MRRRRSALVAARAAVLAAIALSATACDAPAFDAVKEFFERQGAGKAGEAPKEAPQAASGLDLDALLLTTAPGADFYQFANGGAKSGQSAFFKAELEEAQRVRSLASAVLTEAPETIAPDLYAAAIALSAHADLAAIDARGFASIEADLAAIAGLKTHADVARAFADPGLAPMTPIAVYAAPSAKGDVTAHLTQWGLGLGARRRQLDPDNDPQRRAYLRYIQDALALIDAPSADVRAGRVFDLETAIARAHWSSAKARNRDLLHRKVSTSGLPTLAPGFPWREYLEAAGLANEAMVILREDSAIIALAKMFSETPVEDWRAYLTFHLFHANAKVLPADARNLRAAFEGAAPSDPASPLLRWRDGLKAYRAAVGPPFAAHFAAAAADSDTVRAATALAWDIRAAAERRFRSSSKLSPEAQKEASRKLTEMTIVIGDDISAALPSLKAEPFKPTVGAAYENLRALRRWSWTRARDALGANQTVWTTPRAAFFDALAFYDPQSNEVRVSAALLRPPFFDPKADAAANYGALGAIIGHELSHAFDWEGRKIDASGRLADWWSAEDEQRWRAEREKLSNQLSAANVPGEALPEAIADVVGLQFAHDAYIAHLGSAEAPEIAGATGDQRFFLAWAQIWRRPQPNVAATRAHPPPAARANLAVRNLAAWHDAFRIDNDDPMALPPTERAAFW
ncbi:MAG: M13 family metallopeptidase [Pseudomonadota bacterium]